jgi:superfamily II DNA or RNA helicase
MSTILGKEGYLLKKSKFDKDIIVNLKRELMVQPQQHFKGVKKKIIRYPVYQENDKYLCIPKFYGLKKFGKPDKNTEPKGEKTNYEFKGVLRGEQQKDIFNKTKKSINTTGGGLICAGCGVGKTFMGLYIAHHYKVKTLVIVHKTFLLNQWREEIKNFTTAKVGIIQQNKVEVEGNDIVIGMLQSIAKEKYDPDIFNDFGLIIFDEAHHAPSEYFSKALPIINCKLSLALSATPKRADRMEKVLYWYLGDICYKAPPKKNNNVNVDIYKYNLKHQKFAESYMYNGEVNRPRTLNRIVKLKKRNKFILKILFDIMDEEDRQVLLLSDRIEHLQNLQTKIDEDGRYTCGYYVGGMKQQKLDESSKCQIVLGSYGMASEGLNIPTLNTLIMATPRKEVEQSIGRIMRKTHENITPLVIDIIDQLPCYYNQGMNRKRLYKRLDYNMILHEVENNKILSSINISKEPISKSKKPIYKKVNYGFTSSEDED